MSAIFGILRFDGDEASRRDLERMGNVLAHRGPDGINVTVAGPAGLGHGLMRVNREDRFEAQPLYDRESDATLVADLRLDNREELARALDIGDHELRDMPDSALLMRAYKEWGEPCVERLLGDFAFAIWDGRRRKLVLGRDHMGQRYVHHYIGPGFFAFATEIKALWAVPDVPRRPSMAAISAFLLFQRSSRDSSTFFEDIHLIPGGATLTVQADGAITTRRYWEPAPAAAHLGRDDRYYVDTYRRVLSEAVECRIRRLITPPALLLSGGYDSTAIAGLSRGVLAGQGRRLIALSSVLPEGDARPLRSVRPWAEMCRRDMPHLDLRYFVRNTESCFTNAERLFAATDAVPSPLQYVTDALFQMARAAGSRLVMDGVGGDETINRRVLSTLQYFLRTRQFRRFAVEFAAQRRATQEPLIRMLWLHVVAPLLPLRLRAFAHRLRRGPEPIGRREALQVDYIAAQVASGAIRPSDLMGRLEPHLSGRERALRSLRNWATQRRRTEANEAAARGLDLTRPFCDKRVVELGLAIPEDMYIQSGRHRDLACRALADVYPREFQTRTPGQDALEPGWRDMVAAELPRIESEIARLAQHPDLARYVDFDRLGEMIAATGDDSEASRTVFAALRTFHAARYLGWIGGANRVTGRVGNPER